MIGAGEEPWLNNKFLILDTNVLINSIQHRDSFKVFYDFLAKKGVILYIDAGVRFEFLRGANAKSERDTLENFLESLKISTFPPSSALIETTLEIANIYSCNIPGSNKQISFVDCLLAAQMQTFNKNPKSPMVYLATTDHGDFPKFFKRESLYTFSLSQTNIVNIGIYSTDHTAFELAKKNYLSR